MGSTGGSPGLIGTIAELGGIMLGIFVAPPSLHFDRKYVQSESEWEPSRVYYLVAIPYLTIIVTAIYLYKRKKAIGV